MLRSTPVVDEAIDYRLWELIEKITRFHKILAWIKTFFFHFTNQQPRQANKSDSSLEVVTQASGNSVMPDNVLENCSVSHELTLTSTIFHSIIVIDIDSCSVFAIWFLWPCCLKDPWTQLPSRIWHNRKLPVNRKTELHLNSVTALYCNSNWVKMKWVSIMWSIMTVFIDKCCLHLKNLKFNMYLVSYCILIDFVSTQWPNIFC